LYSLNLKPVPLAGSGVPGLDGIVEAAGSANDGNVPYFPAVNLVQSAGFEARGHQEHVGGRFNLVGDGVIVGDLDGNLLWGTVCSGRRNISSYVFVAAPRATTIISSRASRSRDLRDQIETFLSGEAGMTPITAV